MGSLANIICKPLSFDKNESLSSKAQGVLLEDMVTLRRWLKAQEYEQSFWTSLARRIEADARHQLDWYQWKASELDKRLEKHVDPDQRDLGRVLEIGSGPIGIVNCLEWGQRFAIDPLEDFYEQSPTLTKLRKPGVAYLKGTGENLPYPESFFSVVIIDNVIDHTHSPEKVLDEIYRVLKKNGLLYLAVNIRTAWGAMIHRVLAALYVDKGHPHTITKEAIRELLMANHFEIFTEEFEDYHDLKKKNCRSTDLKAKIKGYLGISEFEYHVVCQKGYER